MRRAPFRSARAVALAVAICALGVAGGCGHETFNLLPDDMLAGAGSSAGSPFSAGAGAGGGAATAGKAGSGGSSGKAGSGGSGGSGGRFGNPPGGSTGSFPCLGEGGCADEDPFCPPSYLFCQLCRNSKDCSPGDSDYCDPDLRRCVECRDRSQCGLGETCNPLTRRCAKICEGYDNENCAVDSQRFLCRPELGDADCTGYGPLYARCYLFACVECFEDHQCTMGQSCMSGRCGKH